MQALNLDQLSDPTRDALDILVVNSCRASAIGGNLLYRDQSIIAGSSHRSAKSERRTTQELDEQAHCAVPRYQPK